MNKNHRLWFLSAIVACSMVLFVSGCGKVFTENDPGGAGVTTTSTTTSTTVPLVGPWILSISPTRDAVDVSPTADLTAVFSESMNAASINALTFTLNSSLGQVLGTVTYTQGDKTAVFNPVNPLTNSTVYTAKISTSVKNLDGENMQADYSWSFTTKAYDADLLRVTKQGNAGEIFGSCVSIIGDVNADGKADYIVGAPKTNVGAMNNAGSAYVYSGANGSLIGKKDGTAQNAGFGASVLGIGDLDGRGTPDFIVGAPGVSNGKGAIYAYSGEDGTLLGHLEGTADGDNFGSSLAVLGDVDDDGAPDFVVGAPGAASNKGAVSVYSGKGPLIRQLNGATSGDRFGASVSVIGDVNNDHKAEFIVGAPFAGANCNGVTYVYSGADGSELYVKDDQTAGAGFGFSVSGAGDVNADGAPDFIVGQFPYADGSSTDNPRASAIYVYSGINGQLLYKKDAPIVGNGFGCSVANLGDVNADGRPEFIVGAPLEEVAPIGRLGSVYVCSGSDGAILCRKNGQVANGGFAYSVSGGGDVNADGRPDFIVGTYSATTQGRAYVYCSD